MPPGPTPEAPRPNWRLILAIALNVFAWVAIIAFCMEGAA